MATLLNGGDNYNDITFQCKSRKVRAHRCVLAARWQDHKDFITVIQDENVIVLDDTDADVLEQVLTLLYTGEIVLPKDSRHLLYWCVFDIP